jgi:hypothetical protein
VHYAPVAPSLTSAILFVKFGFFYALTPRAMKVGWRALKYCVIYQRK